MAEEQRTALQSEACLGMWVITEMKQVHMLMIGVKEHKP